MFTMFSIEGKVALVTGGSSGIGFETAKQLLNNGARGVVIADVNPQTGETACEILGEEFGKTRVVFVQTDVADKLSFEDAFKRTLSEFKKIDILVNNAGIYNEIDYEKLIAVNLTGTIHGTYLAIENYMLNHKTGDEGIIMNTVSTAGCYPYGGAPIYGATKGGVVNLTMALGSKVHYERTKVKLVAIAPGATSTNLLGNLVHRNRHFEEVTLQTLDNTVLQQPEFVAKEMIKIMREKPSGTVWVCEGNHNIHEYVPTPPLRNYY